LRLSVIGCGYVGSSHGACFAEAGHEVVCTDVDRERIAKLNAGGIPIYEEHLDQILAPPTRPDEFPIPTTPVKPSAPETPSSSVWDPAKGSGEADLSAIDNVARQSPRKPIA